MGCSGSKADSSTAPGGGKGDKGGMSESKRGGPAEDAVLVALKAKRRGFVGDTSIDDDAKYVKKSYPKSKATRKVIQKALQDNFLFATLQQEEYDEVVDAMSQEVVNSGTMVIQQGKFVGILAC